MTYHDARRVLLTSAEAREALLVAEEACVRAEQQSPVVTRLLHFAGGAIFGGLAVLAYGMVLV